MAQRFAALEPKHEAFIARQRVFFTASAAPLGCGEVSRVNVSPRSTDCLRVLGPNAVCYLDRTGSGNETAAHARAGGKTTVMLCAFEGPPLILRLYGKATVLPLGSDGYAALLAERYEGEEPLGARQIVVLDVETVQTSCGYGVPLFEHRGERSSMDNWAEAQLAKGGGSALDDYRREHNARSIDGLLALPEEG